MARTFDSSGSTESGMMLSTVESSSRVLSRLVSSYIKRSGMAILTSLPSFLIMSSVPPSRARAYSHASDLPTAFWDALMQNEAAANIILPFAKKALDFPREEGSDQLWIVLYDETSDDVEFVLSCTKGPLGNYPIFVFTPKSSVQLALEGRLGKSMTASLLQLVLCLLREVSPQRVFSVFSIAMVAEKFAEIFEEHTHGIHALEDPYRYDATFTFCTRETLKKASVSFSSRPESEDILIALCHADTSHLEGIKALCKGFSFTSVSSAYIAWCMNHNVFCTDSRLINLMTNVRSWRLGR